MANKDLELSIAIGGHLHPELGKSINQVQKALEALGLAGTETQEKLDAISKVNANQLALEKMCAKLEEAITKEKVATEKLEQAQQRGGKVQESLIRKKAMASATVAKLRKATDDLAKKNEAYKKSVTELYGPIDKLKASEESLKKTRAQMVELQKKQLALDASIEKRTQAMYAAQMRITAASTIASKLQTPLEAAMEGERLNFELGTVINVDEKGKQDALARAREVGNELARAGYASFAETQDIQYALNSAGLTAALSSDAVKAVASVSKVTKGEMAQVGEVMATVYYNLGARIDGTDAERFNRIGELLTKTQFKYQIRNFGQLGESMQKGAQGIRQYNAQLEQSIAALGMLNSAGLQGGEAGTAYYAMLRGFLKTAQEIPSVLQKTANGELDVVASLRELNRGMVKMDEVQRAQFMSEMFGDEGAAALVPLLDKLDELENGYKDVRDSSHGIVDKNMADYLQLTSTRLNAARESGYALARTLGGALAPAVKTGFDGLNKIAEVLGAFAEANPTLTKAIVLGAAALVGVNLLVAGVLYLKSGFSTLVTAVGKTVQFLRLYRAALAGVEVASMKGGKAALALARSWEIIKGLAIIAKVKAAAAAQTAWNASLAAGRWLLDAGKLIVYRGAIMVVSAATKAWAAVQWALNTSLIAGRWLFDAGRLIAYRGAILVVSAATKSWAAVQWALNASLIAGRWLFDAGRLIAYRGAILVVSAATKAWAAIQWVLNAALSANPIGLLITAIAGLVAGIAVLYKKFEGVRKVIDATWGALKRAGSAVASFFGFGDDEGEPQDPSAPGVPGGGGGTTQSVPAFGGGGYVGSKTFALIAEKGPEMVVPLANRSLGMKRLAQAASILNPVPRSGGRALQSAPPVKQLIQAGQTVRPAGEGALASYLNSNSVQNNSYVRKSDSDVSINYSPTIIIQGNADRGVISATMRSERENLRQMLREMFEEMLHEKERTALA